MNSMIEELMQIKPVIGDSQLLGPGNPNSVLYFLSIAVSYTTNTTNTTNTTKYQGLCRYSCVQKWLPITTILIT